MYGSFFPCPTARSAAVSLLLLLGALKAYGADTYSAGYLSIPSLSIGGATYTSVVVAIGSILKAPADTTPYTSIDSYNPANH
jgi:hypothetical protein